MTAAQTRQENEKVDELIASVAQSGLSIPVDQQLQELQRRIEGIDGALIDARGVLVSTRDPNFQPDGWKMPVGEAISDLIAQKERLTTFRDALQAPPPPG
jgi:hypothetical protein